MKPANSTKVPNSIIFSFILFTSRVVVHVQHIRVFERGNACQYACAEVDAGHGDGRVGLRHREGPSVLEVKKNHTIADEGVSEFAQFWMKERNKRLSPSFFTQPSTTWCQCCYKCSFNFFFHFWCSHVIARLNSYPLCLSRSFRAHSFPS